VLHGSFIILCSGGGKLMSRPNNALVSDACAAALRAFFSAAQRGR
jgi:hypothetical protein